MQILTCKRDFKLIIAHWIRVFLQLALNTNKPPYSDEDSSLVLSEYVEIWGQVQTSNFSCAESNTNQFE